MPSTTVTFEILKGRADEAWVLAFRPPLDEHIFRSVASAIGKTSPQKDAFQFATVGPTTEFSWTLAECNEQILGRFAGVACRYIQQNTAHTAKVLSDEMVRLDGAADVFTQAEEQQCISA